MLDDFLLQQLKKATPDRSQEKVPSKCESVRDDLNGPTK